MRDYLESARMVYFVVKECSPSWKLNDSDMSFFSLVFVLEGGADYIINGENYSVAQGDLVFIKRGSSRLASTRGMTCAALDFMLDTEEQLDYPVLTSRHNFTDFGRLFRELNFEWLQRRDGYQLKCQALFRLILHKLLYEEQRGPDNAHVAAIKRHVVEHYDSKLTTRSLARLVNLNPVYCGALFKQLEGCSISEFIHRVRIHKAAALLESGEYNVGEAAEKTGYRDIYYFSNMFKRLMGVSPKAYRNKPL